MKSGLLILLDGVTSAGKTSLATHIAKKVNGSVVLSVDTFILRRSNRLRWFFKSKCLRQNLDFLSIAKEFHSEIVRTSSRHNIVVVDTILLDARMRDDILERVDRNCLLYIKVYCPLKILEERERNRESCKIGGAESQFDNVYSYLNYDLKVDTGKFSTADCAQKVLDFLHNKLLKSNL